MHGYLIQLTAYQTFAYLIKLAYSSRLWWWIA